MVSFGPQTGNAGWLKYSTVPEILAPKATGLGSDGVPSTVWEQGKLAKAQWNVNSKFILERNLNRRLYFQNLDLHGKETLFMRLDMATTRRIYVTTRI